MSIFYTLLGFLLNVGVMLLLVAAILVAPIILVARDGRRWTAAGASRRKSLRIIETLQFAIGLIVLGVMWTFGSHFTWPPAAIAESVESIRSLNMQVLATGAVLGLIAIFVTWRFSTVIGMLGLVLIGGVALVAFTMSIDTVRTEEFERTHHGFASAPTGEGVQPEPPDTPIRFETLDQLPGADLWVNGVKLGKTPVEITARELLSKVPDWTNESLDRQAIYQHSPGNQWTDSTGKLYRRWGWCPLHFTPHIGRSTQLYFKVDLNNVVGYSEMAQQSLLRPGKPDESIVVKLDTVFPQWELEIESLLDRARVTDYVINEEWATAFRSYGDFSAKHLERSFNTEPAIAKLKDIDPTLSGMLQDVKDSESAWRLLMKIEDEARRTRSYNSGSANGLAVDQIVPLLDPQQLVDHALELLRTTKNPDPSGYGYGEGRFSTYNDDGDNKPREEAALFPIAQAVWRMDQALDLLPTRGSKEAKAGSLSFAETDSGIRVYKGMVDAIDPSADNIVESVLTPELLRMSYSNENRLQYADLLGGSVYESFLLRNDWHTPATSSFDGVSIGNFENYVNKWYYRLMRLRTPLGHEFRRQQNSNLLEVARKGMTQFSLSSDLFPGALGFLFLDREYSKDHPSLAMQFWPAVKAVTDGNSVNQSFQIRWDYLGRLWPESTPAMFIDVIDDAFRTSDYINLQKFPDTMTLEDQTQVLTAVIHDQQQRVAQLPRVPGDDSNYQTPRQKHLRVITGLRDILYRLPCEPAASQLLADMKAEPDHWAHNNMASFLNYDTTHEDLIRLIATGDDIKLQRDVLPAIQNHPIPERVKLLDVLLKSADETVRTEAAAVQTYLEKLRTQPLPHRAELRP